MPPNDPPALPTGAKEPLPGAFSAAPSTAPQGRTTARLGMSLQDACACFVHLRLMFQFFLSPIFLWGFLLADGRMGLPLLIGYLAFHLFGYAGGTAFNSYYDRDTGPIGGLEHPPPVPSGLLPFALAWQFIGLVATLTLNLLLVVIYVSMFALSVAYSHPRIRFKGKPVAALTTVALGQGVLAFLAGWACARGELSSVLALPALMGLAAATLLTVGFYPLTEIYQIAEDRQRGDRTLAIWLGPARTFRFAQVSLVVGGLCAIGLIILRYQPLEALLLSLFLAGVFVVIRGWSRAFSQASIADNFRMAMRLYAVLSLGFMGWIAFRLIVP